MAFWRMQLHPNHPAYALRYTVESLVAGYIGLDFDSDEPVGDLTTVPQQNLPEKQRYYASFAHDMRIGDSVLIFVHNFPFALVTVSGEYNYIKECAPEIGVWFRHFRRIETENQLSRVSYYGDYQTDAHQWVTAPMPGTIGPLQIHRSSYTS
jgi:hypothetical protein